MSKEQEKQTDAPSDKTLPEEEVPSEQLAHETDSDTKPDAKPIANTEQIVSTEEAAEGGDEEASDSKVISRGSASLIVSGADKIREEASQPKALTPEPREWTGRKHHHEEEDVEEEPQDEETVERLESSVKAGKERVKVEVAKFEKLERKPNEAEVQESQWGDAVSTGWWIAIAGVSSMVLLIGGLIIKGLYDGDEAHEVAVNTPAYQPQEPDPFEGTPKKWFHDRSGLLRKEAVKILESFLAAPDRKAKSTWVRSPETYLEKSGLRDVQLKPRLQDIEEKSWNLLATGDRAFLTVDCKDDEFMPFRAYFTREGEVLKLDWLATTAWSSVDFATIKADAKARRLVIDKIERNHRLAKDRYFELLEARQVAIEAKRKQDEQQKQRQENSNPDQPDQPEQPVMPPVKEIVIPPVPATVEDPVYPELIYQEPFVVRCKFRRRDEFYAGPYNDSEHSAFMLISPDSIHYMWAYVERDSELDLELRRLLDHGRFVVDLKKDLRVTLRVKGPQNGALPSQLELLELIHSEWVTP